MSTETMLGSRLGPYEITSKLGEGGMGEVYRATDSRLKREVAIKVLPPAFAADRERVARFEREAQLLAQLHHPNIASIFGLEQEAGGVLALVMESVDGEDLSARIARGPLPLEEALAVARQIADALEAAHEHGIVHRDLKPANVKLRPDGAVKVLDFGLAKAMESGVAGASPMISPTLVNSPTVTGIRGTQLGVILGTAAYMSPEQARGHQADRRADVWAFGVVLFEMLTGRSLFAAETVTDTLAGVLRADVDLAQLPPGTPAALRTLLRRCLERNPRERLRDIGEARIALAAIAAGAGDEGEGAVGASGRVVSRRALIAGSLLALLVGAGAGWLLHRAPPPDAGTGASWALAIPDGLSLATYSAPNLALSADGRRQVAVVVDANLGTRLLLRSSDQLEPRLLPDTSGATSPFVSPDGEWIAFFREHGLYKIPTAGGPPVLLADTNARDTTRGGTWSRDGFLYFAPSVNSGLSRVSENGGPVTQVTRIDETSDERTHRWPQALPDGSAVLFTCDTFASIEYYDDARIEAVRPATGERKVLVEGASQARYAGGKLIFARGGSLFAVTFDPRTLTVHGAPDLVAQSVATDVSSGAVQFALSPSGAALWVPGGLSAHYQLVWVDAHGAETLAPVPPAPYNEAALSPDGRQVALVGGPGGAGDLWVVDLARGSATRLTEGGPIFNPVWSPDGTHLAYVARTRDQRQHRRWQLLWRVADGSRDPELLVDSDLSLSASAVTPDGGTLIYGMSKREGSGADVYLLPLGGTRKPELLLGGPFNKRDAIVSPDGHWLTYTTSEGGQSDVFVRPFPSGEGRWQISGATGLEPRWSPDGRALFYRDSTWLRRVAVDTTKGFVVGKPEPVIDRVSVAGAVHTYSVMADGRIFTTRSPAGRGSLRTVYLDLGFARRVAALGRATGGQ